MAPAGRTTRASRSTPSSAAAGPACRARSTTRRCTRRESSTVPSFQGIEQLWRGKNEALAFIRLPESAPDPGGFHVHPALLDACFQMIGAGLPEDAVQDGDTVYLAVNVDRMRVERAFGKSLWTHVRVKPADDSLAGNAGRQPAPVRRCRRGDRRDRRSSPEAGEPRGARPCHAAGKTRRAGCIRSRGRRVLRLRRAASASRRTLQVRGSS